MKIWTLCLVVAFGVTWTYRCDIQQSRALCSQQVLIELLSRLYTVRTLRSTGGSGSQVAPQVSTVLLEATLLGC